MNIMDALYRASYELHVAKRYGDSTVLQEEILELVLAKARRQLRPALLANVQNYAEEEAAKLVMSS